MAAEPTTRQLVLAAVGIVVGAAAGMTAGFAAVAIWLSLGLPKLNDDPKALATIAAFVLPAIICGAVLAPTILIRRQRRGRPLRWPAVALGVVAAPSLLFWLRLLLG